MLDISSPANWVLILSHNSHHTLNLIHEKLPATHGNQIRLRTRYFSADIPFKLKTKAQLPGLLNDPEFIRFLQTAPAIVLVAKACDDISECQQIWDSIKNSVREDAARVLLLLEDASGAECETQNLIEWAVSNEIEIVSEDICEGSSVWHRFLELLSCAPWRIQSHTDPSRATGIEQTDAERPKGQASDYQNLEVEEVKPASEAVSVEDPQDRTLLNLSKATRLRRGLLEKDISNILEDLLLADSDQDDAEQDWGV